NCETLPGSCLPCSGLEGTRPTPPCLSQGGHSVLLSSRPCLSPGGGIARKLPLTIGRFYYLWQAKKQSETKNFSRFPVVWKPSVYSPSCRATSLRKAPPRSAT